MNSIIYPNRVRRTSAFTIIELLVALTVTAAISGMMVAIVINILNAWSRSSATLTSGNQVRQILDLIATDLSSMVMVRSTDVMFAATIPLKQTLTGDAKVTSAAWPSANIKPEDTVGGTPVSLQRAPADRDLANYRFGQAGVWLRFFTQPADNTSPALSDLSAPRAVSYQIIRNRVGSSTAPYTYQLFRSEVRPHHTDNPANQKSTFANGYDLFGNNGYNDPSLASGGTNLADAGGIRRPRAESVLANGVIDFGVRIYVYSTDTEDIDVDGDKTEVLLNEAFPMNRRQTTNTNYRVFAASTDTTKVQSFTTLSGNFTANRTSYGYPAVVEVMVRILTPEGVEIIQAYETDPVRFGGATTTKWWELAEANSKVYTRRIEMRTGVY
jgi:type II secretory pathway pseudopilin PulG